MKVTFLNLPSEVPVIRRYMCSSFAESFFFPPHDLTSLAGVARCVSGMDVSFMDAVAEGKDFEETAKCIEKESPDVLVSIISFELYDKDVLVVKRLKARFPNLRIILFGHYPTNFPKETLECSNADIVIFGEPDDIFSKLINQLVLKQPVDRVGGIAYRTGNGQVQIGNHEPRVPSPDLLPIPAYDLLNNDLYAEPFMPRPFGLIQTARGCPYQCNYCVHSFGTKLTMLSPENVLEHIMILKKIHGIRSLRFIDDTFTVMPSRVIRICKLMIEKGLDLKWTCLARADMLDEEMLLWMKRAGCVRVNIGMESGSQKILDILNKGMKADYALSQLRNVKKAGIEMMGFFLTGVPGETTEDIAASVRFAHEARFNYVVVDTLKVYPGTPLYNKFQDLIDFSLIPYRNKFKDSAFNSEAAKNRKDFYRKFYFSMNYVFNSPLKNLFMFDQVGHAIDYVLRKSKTA